MNFEIVDKFTTHLRNTLSRSIDLAWEFQQNNIPPLFLLYSLSEQHGSIGAEVLHKSKLTSDVIAAFVRKQRMLSRRTGAHTGVAGATTSRTRSSVPSSPAPAQDNTILLWPEFTTETKKVIERSALFALEFKHQYIGTEHLLLSLFERPDEAVIKLIKQQKVQPEAIKNQLLQIMGSATKFHLVQSIFSATETRGGAPGGEHARMTNAPITPTPSQPTSHMTSTPTTSQPTHHHAVDAVQEPPAEQSETPALDYFGVDLTSKEHMDHIDPVIGRQNEIERLMHILSRRTKNNPVLIGDPGVGKTAIVEGLAKRIAEGNVPSVLLGKRVVALDLSLVIAGTMYRGEFESRLKQIIDEVKTHPDVLLFIDEIHTLVGAGGVQGGSMDAANILKPALAKGDIACIGATTADEYRKYIERDPALDRRFQPIIVREPSVDEAIQMLRGLRSYYEDFHHISVSDAVIETAVRLSARYLPERRLPDKAIDVLDEAGAKAHVLRPVPEILKQFHQLHRLLKKVHQKKDSAVRAEQFDTAIELKNQEQELVRAVDRMEQKVEALHFAPTIITAEDIAQVISSITAVPMNHMLATTTEQLGLLEEKLSERIVGQDDVIKTVAGVIKRARAGLSSPKRPLGSFLFLGPSGVGKTELTKAIAEICFGDPNALIRLDMSEFSEGFTVSKLIGSPAGYVGHNESVKLSDQIRRRPYSVVLFDEIEKAHPDIYNLLLQVLEDGRLTDATGRELNFRNTVVVLTSNIGIQALNKQAELGFEDTSKKKERKFDEVASTIIAELQEYFPIEFLNRIDHQIVFRPLDEREVQTIVEMQFAELRRHLAERNIDVRMLASARSFIARKSFSAEQGARMVRRTLTQLVEEQLADDIIAGSIQTGDVVKISCKQEKLVFAVQRKKV